MKDYDQIVSAKLVAYTQLDPDYDVPLADAQELIAYCAKVSNPSMAKQADMENSDKLIKYLVKHAHWSPLEMVDAVLEIVTTRDIARQMLRHKSFSFQEFSQRYAAALTGEDQGIELVLSDARRQDEKNRQNSIKLDIYTNQEDWKLQRWWLSKQRDIALLVHETYAEALIKGLAKETARKILPEGMTTSKVYMKGSIRSWIHYLELRKANGTQLEHQMIARGCSEVISKIFPMMEERT